MKMWVWPILLLVFASLVCQEASADDKKSCNCGWINKGRIVGGKAAKKHQFPWMAALWGKNKVMCGATIITKHHAISAAHCNIDTPLVLVVGLYDTRNYIAKKDSDAITIQIEKIIDHPGYAADKYFKDDIALVVTKTEIPFSTNVGPACFPKEPIDLDYEKVTAIGWGYDRLTIHPPYILQQINLTIITHSDCRVFWGRQIQNPPTQICAMEDVYQGLCYGDSGGPLVWLEPESKRYILVGVPSFVKKGCDFPPPTVLTDVTKYVSWIKKTIKENKPTNVCSKF